MSIQGTGPTQGTGTTSQLRVAIVTGGSGGIGRAVAERLAANGQAVVVVYSSNEAQPKTVLEGITGSGGRAVAVKADVADEVAVSEVFDVAEQQLSGVDVVVNCAGSIELATVAEADLADVDRMHRTNIRGTFVVAQQAARRIRAGGAIVNVSTSVVKLQQPTYAAYAASKGAVEAMTLILAKELRGRDITVDTVAPGPTATALFTDDKTEEAIAAAAKMNPLERLGQPEDVAEVVAWLAGPARWINGQTIYANGGMA